MNFKQKFYNLKTKMTHWIAIKEWQKNVEIIRKKERPKEIVQKLLKYDVISFDVFDTLILRPFSKPSDLFGFTGTKLNYLDFQHHRIQTEKKVRQRVFKTKTTYEVTFEEIWNELAEKTGIDKEIGMVAELEDEFQYCFANVHLLEVIKKLREYDKKIIIISDMYLEKQYIQQLLKKCGYPDFDEYFVSCDYRKSKSEGTLYNIVKEQFLSTIVIVHVGDNLYSDVIQAKKHGFMGIHYQID